MSAVFSLEVRLSRHTMILFFFLQFTGNFRRKFLTRNAGFFSNKNSMLPSDGRILMRTPHRVFWSKTVGFPNKERSFGGPSKSTVFLEPILSSWNPFYNFTMRMIKKLYFSLFANCQTLNPGEWWLSVSHWRAPLSLSVELHVNPAKYAPQQSLSPVSPASYSHCDPQSGLAKEYILRLNLCRHSH